MERRYLLISASMGAGHDAVADELARRLRDRGHTVLRQDLLALLPAGTGPALRTFYRTAVRRLPGLYAGIYRTFLAGGPGPRPDVSPLAAVAERPVREVVDRWRPDGVVSTFHLAAQVTGRLRAHGVLGVRSTVVVTDFALHRGWLHAGNDLHLCLTEAAAGAARSGTGRPAVACGPVVPPGFHAPVPSPLWRDSPVGTAGRPAVLLSAGAWGVGPGLLETAGALAGHGCLPVLLCGHDQRLRRRAARLPGVLALGWVADLPGLMAAARLLVDNAAGQTAVQALAAGLPVIGYRPLAGHGAHGVREMAAAGLSVPASGPRDLLSAVDALVVPGPARDRQTARGRSAFRSDAAEYVAAPPGTAPREP
ncbi:MGDG synthase family glycosyltransferase [Streptomyces sp. bgisy100]|uniref:MGDG synthase family glycosyltransferase n=1 Tax=Streptomyces sp. bgisy100 TaxID=3413783 RepID=UPI003D70EBD3